MVISLLAYRRYLKNRASPWERLALTRARCVAGDPDLGRKVQQAIHRFVFRDPVDRSLGEEILHVRGRMEPKKERGQPTPVDINRGPGGLVDVEFIAQIQVVKLAKQQRHLRLNNARQVLEELTRMGVLNGEDGALLLSAHDHFRLVEKAMRINSNQTAQILPTGRELTVLSRAVDAENGEQLVKELTDTHVARA